MRNHFPTFAALALSLIGGVLTPTVKAGEWDKQTNITIDRPIEVQDKVLPAGSYVLKLADLPAERHIIQIFTAQENHLIATVFAVPIYRSVPADNSEFKFYESENGQPPALHTWFYPGENTGFEFRAGRGMAVESAQSRANTTSSSVGGN
jgi:hypothetical protein